MDLSMVGDTMKDVRTSVAIEMWAYVAHSAETVETNHCVTMRAIRLVCWRVRCGFQNFGPTVEFKRDNGNDHRAAAIDIVFKSRAARGSVCIVLLSGITLSQPLSRSFASARARLKFLERG